MTDALKRQCIFGWSGEDLPIEAEICLASGLPFDQASSDTALIVAATKRPTFHKNYPILKVNTLGYTPTLLPNLFVACGLLPAPISPVLRVGMLCHVIQGINPQAITFVRVFPITFIKLIA